MKRFTRSYQVLKTKEFIKRCIVHKVLSLTLLTYFLTDDFESFESISQERTTVDIEMLCVCQVWPKGGQ